QSDGCDPCKVDPQSDGCDPCKVDPQSDGCDPCKVYPQSDGCDPCKVYPQSDGCVEPKDPDTPSPDQPKVVPIDPDTPSPDQPEEIYCKDSPEDDECIDIVDTRLGGEKIPNQYLVLLKNYFADKHEASLSSLQDLTAKVKNLGVEVLDVYEKIIPGFAIRAPNEEILGNVLTILENDSRIGVLEQDQTIVAFGDAVPNGIKRVDGGLVKMGMASESGSIGNIDIDIAIIDSGIDLDNPELNIFRNTTVVPNTITADDDIRCGGHGTHVAGIAAAKDNGIGIAGVAPGARLWAVKALEFNPSKGICEGSVTSLLSALKYVQTNADKIDVVNLSLGCLCISNELKEAVFQMIDETVKKNVTLVVAAGNSHMDAGPLLMVSHPDVITVSAMSDSDGKCGQSGKISYVAADGRPSKELDDTFASFSNYGDVIDIAAPGVKINSTSIDGAYAQISGTSQAAPHVAGAAALFKLYNPLAPPSEIRSELIRLGSQLTTECDGNGHGYFTGDLDSDREALLYVKNLLQNTTNMVSLSLRSDE
ncbi:MAG: S8 family serine peptidase, partial [Nitrososphaeraceae archaeon]